MHMFASFQALRNYFHMCMVNGQVDNEFDRFVGEDIVESRASNSEKLEKLGQTMFGRDW